MIVGYKNLTFRNFPAPELMKGLGKGVKSFKDGVNGKDEVVPDETGKTPEGQGEETKEEVKQEDK